MYPIIYLVNFSTSSGVFNTLTPPFNPEVKCPFPLPPAWTYALRIKPPDGSNGMATFLAYSGVRAMSPFYTRILNFLIISFD